MAVLVLDTATETLAVAVGNNHALLGSAAYRVVRGHSVLLQPVMAEVLAHAGIKMDSLQTIAVGIGPGSYTGVRIGVSTAKAMASVLGVDLVTMPTLFTLAEAAAPGQSEPPIVVLTMLYARRQRAFGAVYQRVMGRWEELQAPQVRLVTEWLEELSTLQQRSPAAYDFRVVHDFVERYGLDDVMHTHPAHSVLRLEDVAGQFGPALFRLVDAGEGVRVKGPEIHRILPEYALPVEAEVKLAGEGGLSHGNR